MNQKWLFLISLLAAMVLLAACGRAQQSAGRVQIDGGDTVQPTAISRTNAQASETLQLEANTQALASTARIAQPTPTIGLSSDQQASATDVMRSGRTLAASPVYLLPDSQAGIEGELESGESVIVTRALDDWYEIIYNDGATRHAWLPQSAITFGALPVAAQNSDAMTIAGTAEETPTPEVFAEPVAEIAPVSAPAKTAAPSSTEQGVIVFQTSSGGSIYSMNADGSNLHLITTGGLDPALSPDGDQIAYTRWDEPRGLFVANTDGSDERWLVEENLVKNPAWSSDGEQLVFNVQSGGSEAQTIRTPRGERTLPADPHWRLQVIDATGENLAGVADNMHSWNPDWSEQGILYAAEDGLYVTDPDGSPYHIYESANAMRNPAWSPDGQSIIASMEFHDHWEVVRINRDGTGLVRLDKNYDGVHSVAPAWSADGEQILYLSDRSGEWALWVMDADGGNKRLLAPDTLSDIDFRYDFNAEQVADWR